MPPPLSDRTVSMPALNDGGTPFRNYPGRALPPGWDRPPTRKPLSRGGETPPGSVEDVFVPPGQWKTACFRSSPGPEPVRVSALASVRNGWLPVQKRAVVCDVTGHAPPPKDSTCQDQCNPSNATSIHKCFIKRNCVEYTDGKEKDMSTQGNCMEPRTRRLSGQASPNVMQTSNQASLESDSPLGLEKWKKGWVERRRAAFLSAGVQPGDHNAAPHRHSPLHGTASASVPSRAAVPPFGLETLPMKPRFSSIMAMAQRIPRSHTSSSSSGGTAESDSTGSSGPPALENPPAKSPPAEPVVLRRRASAIKVTDAGGWSRRSDETGGPGAGPRASFRNSYSEGDGKENGVSRFCLQGGADPPAGPSARTEARAGFANDDARHPRRQRSSSLAEPEGSVKKIYRSTLSFFLCGGGAATAGDPGKPPARPLSFAGAFRHADPGPGGPPDPAAERPSIGSPGKANVGQARDAACSFNALPPSVGYPGTGASAESSEQDTGARQGPGLHPGQDWSQHPAVVKPQAVSPTMNPEGHRIHVGLKDRSSFDTHQSAEAILALNAASIIASIKLQTRINKMANLLSEQESNKSPELENKTVENSGSHESGPPTGGVVRRVHGNTGRKARPHPIYWQEPHSDQQENHKASLTLREALELQRPDFIRRSQRRVMEVEQRAQKRRARQRSAPEAESTQATRRTTRRTTRPNPLSGDHCKLGDRSTAGKEIGLRCKSNAPDIKRNRQEEKKKVVLQTNMLRAAAFKKELLDKILRRNKD